MDEKYAREIVAHAFQDDPNECCGIIAGKDGKILNIYRISNTEASPYRYKMDPGDHYRSIKDMEDNGWETIAFYHSHTHTPAYPSDTDVRMATWDGTSIWPGVKFNLVSLENREHPSIKAFSIEDGTVTEEDMTIC